MTTPTFTTQPTLALSGGNIVVTPGATTDTVSTAYTWLRDQVPLDGETGTSISAAAYPGAIQIVQTATGAGGETASAISAAFANGTNDTIVFQDDFNGATNNRPLTNWGHGWTVNGADSTQQSHILTLAKNGEMGLGSFVRDSGVDTGGGHFSYAVAHVDTGVTNHAIEADILTGNGNHAVFGYKDDLNFCELQWGGTGGVVNLAVFSIVNGVRTSRMTGAYTFQIPSPTIYGTIRVELIGGLVSLFYKHDGATLFTQYGLSTSGPKPGSDTIDLSGVAGIQLGTGIGIRPDAGFTNMVRAIALDGNGLVRSVSVTSAHNSPTISATLQYRGSPSGFDVAVMSATTGAVIMARTAATVDSMAGGSATIHVTSSALRACEGDTVIVQVWPAGGAGDAKTLAIPHYPTIQQTVLGINEGFITRSHAGEAGRNLFEVSSYSTHTSVASYSTASAPDTPLDSSHFAASELGMGFDGVVYHQATSNPDSSKKLTLQLPGFIAPSQAGDYLVTGLPTALIGNAVQFAGTGMTVKTPAANGSCVVTVAANPTEARVSRTMTLVGNFNEPIYPVAVKVGDSSSERYSDVAVANMAALGRIARFMTARRISGDKVADSTDLQYGARSAAERWTGYTGTGAMPVEFCLSGCNQAGQHYWHNVSHLADDSLVAAEAALIADGLDAGLQCYVELSNEVWNTRSPYQEEHCYFRLQGARKGYTNAGTDAPLTIRDFRAGCDQSTYITLAPVADGENIFVSLYGIGFPVYRAIGDQPAGVSVQDPAKFQLVYDNGATDLAGKRAFGERSAEVWAIFDSVFAAAGRPRPIHVLGSRMSSGMTNEQPALDWKGTYLQTDRIAVAPYWGQATVDYSDHGTDNDAFLAQYFADLNAAIDSQIDTSLVPRKAAIMNYCLGKGLAPDAIQLCTYEGGWYGYFPNSPAGFEAAMFKTVVRDPRMGQGWARFMAGWEAKVGGELVQFDRILEIPSADDSAYFSLMEGEDDNVTEGITGNNWRFKAVAEFNAAH